MATILGILFPLLLILVSGHVIWKSTDGFETAADFLGRKMSHGVKGATINAVASSMPEFLTTMFFLFYIKDKDVFVDSFSGGLGVVAGSAVFNILIIPCAVILFGGIISTNKLNLRRKIIFRDGMFLIVSNIVLILIIAQPVLKARHGLILIILYLIYLFILRKGFGAKNGNKVEVSTYEISRVKISFRHLLLLDIKQMILNGKRINPLNAWITLVVSTAVMSFGTWMLVEGTKLLGQESYHINTKLESLLNIEQVHGLGIPVIFLSVLLAAAATSIPDTMISVKDARKGNHQDSLSNAIGSNIFDISFALGFPLMLYIIINGDFSLSENIQSYSFGILLAMWLINTLSIFVFLLKQPSIKMKGIILLFLYLLFILFIVMEKSSTLANEFRRLMDFIPSIL